MVEKWFSPKQENHFSFITIKKGDGSLTQLSALRILTIKFFVVYVIKIWQAVLSCL